MNKLLNKLNSFFRISESEKEFYIKLLEIKRTYPNFK